MQGDQVTIVVDEEHEDPALHGGRLDRKLQLVLHTSAQPAEYDL